MKIYITSVDRDQLKTYFLNFRFYTVVDTKSIIADETISYKDEDLFNLMVEQRIIEELKKAKRKRKYMNLVYITDQVDLDIINNLSAFFDDCELETITYVKRNPDIDVDLSMFDSVIDLSLPLKKNK